MKTKDLNFIEAYEAFKAGHDVYRVNSWGVEIGPMKAGSFNGTFTTENIMQVRAYIKQKPLKIEFDVTVYGNDEVYSKSFGNSGTWGIISGDQLNPVIGKKCKVIVEEIVE